MFGRLDVYIYDYLVKKKLHATAKSFMTEGKVHPDPVGKAQNLTFTLLFKKRGGKVACYSIGFCHNYAGVLEVNGSDSSRVFLAWL
jgi:hypothetical protein